jgi:Putative auto-transporter adhesin, head GIN domain
MKSIFTLLLLIGSCASFAQEKVIFNDEHVVLRDVQTFQSVVVSGPFKVYYSTDAESQVAVSANDTEARDRITTKVNNGTLYISLDNSGVRWWRGNKEFKVYITAPKLNSLTASGAVNIVVVDVLKSNNLSLNFSGASDFTGKVECDEIKANFSGASDTKISGSADKIGLVCTGASGFKGIDLKVNEADLVATGASDIKLYVKETLRSKASGASSIQYKGNPRIFNQTATGASSIKNIN